MDTVKRDVPMGIIFILVSIIILSPISYFINPALAAWWVIPGIVILCSIYLKVFNIGWAMLTGYNPDDTKKQ